MQQTLFFVLQRSATVESRNRVGATVIFVFSFLCGFYVHFAADGHISFASNSASQQLFSIHRGAKQHRDEEWKQAETTEFRPKWGHCSGSNTSTAFRR